MLRVATLLACEGYWRDIQHIQQVSKLFRWDEVLWDVVRDEVGRGGVSHRTRLMHAGFVGDVERLRFLLARGANVNAATRGAGIAGGFTPLMYASQEGHLGCVGELCRHGAAMDSSSSSSSVCGEGGSTALSLATRHNHPHVVQFLLERGVGVPPRFTEDGRSALCWGAWGGHLGIVTHQLERKADVNAPRPRDGATALMGAAEGGYTQVVRLLCARGANVNAATTDSGVTPLMWASKGGHVGVIRELLEAGARPSDATTDDGMTALMEAVYNRHAPCVRELCAWGADVNAARSSDGMTALMWAAYRGDWEMIQFLLDWGADKRAVNVHGLGAFELLLPTSLEGGLGGGDVEL